MPQVPQQPQQKKPGLPPAIAALLIREGIKNFGASEVPGVFGAANVPGSYLGALESLPSPIAPFANAGAAAESGALATGLTPMMGLGAVASVPLVGMLAKKGLQKAFGRDPSTFVYDPAKFIETEKEHLASGRNDSTGWMKLRDQDANWVNRSDDEKKSILNSAKALNLLIAGGQDQPDVSFGINWEKFKPQGDSAALNRPVTRADIERGLQYNPMSRTTTQIKNLPEVLALWDQTHGAGGGMSAPVATSSIDPGRIVSQTKQPNSSRRKNRKAVASNNMTAQLSIEPPAPVSTSTTFDPDAIAKAFANVYLQNQTPVMNNPLLANPYLR